MAGTSGRGGRGGASGAARAIALATPWSAGRFRFAIGDVPGWLGACLAEEVEQRRLFPWLAVAYGTGIVLAFAANGPLSPWPPLVAGTLFAGIGIAMRGRRPAALATMVALAALFFGFAAAVIRTNSVAAPILARITVGKVGGFAESVEERQKGGRFVIRVVSFDKLDPARRPARVRVSARALDGVAPGDYVTGTMRLLPPPEAARPGGYDFARDAYFRGLGAVGSVSGHLAKVVPAPAARDLSLRLAAAVDTARNTLTREIAGAIGGQAGAVAAALITGKRGLIDDHSNDILRAAGIYHIVSISGLHMVLAAGVFFWITRALLALSPTLALGWPIKKIAAVAGMAGAFAYDVFSGSDVATERSLIMILVMQAAILFDRPALSLRNLALSALIVLTREPETLLGPSLQMSYAAVAGLIAFAEWERRRRRVAEAGDPLKRAALWAWRIAFGIVATTVVATIATGPFSTYHFQNLQPYGIIGNAATLPLVSFVVMPCAVLGVVAYPFGLDRPVWTVMGWGVEAVLRLSEWVAGLGGSIVTVPAYGTSALSWLVLAILAATLFVSRLRWIAIVPAALGLALAWSAPRSDVYVARDGSGAAVRARSGRLVVVGRVAGFTAEQWLKADGDARRARDPDVRAGARCDPVGCVVELADGRAVSLVLDHRGFAEDCGRAAIVVSRLTAPAGCGAALVIDGSYLARHGSVAIRATGAGFAVETARQPGDTRPWLARAEPRRSGPAIRTGQKTVRPEADDHAAGGGAADETDNGVEPNPTTPERSRSALPAAPSADGTPAP